MKCIYCEAEIESDDNFCPVCGNITAHGYLFFQEAANRKRIKGKLTNYENNIGSLLFLCLILIFITFLVFSIRNMSIFKPYAYLKKKALSSKYGYDVTLIKNDNTYNKYNLTNLEAAKQLIKSDAIKQKWQCNDNQNVYIIEKQLEEMYKIDNVNFCDISPSEAKKIKETIDKVYALFPNSIGYLTDITITNDPNKNEYVAYFQPISGFINPNENIAYYNKSYKTEILLNSYYFLNEDILNNDLPKPDWYVEDANWESLIAHELGHYIMFFSLLKQNNISDVRFIDSSNNETFNTILKELNESHFSNVILEEAIKRYNVTTNNILSKEEYANRISRYAGSLDTNKEIKSEEVIAEAVHDYYLHGEDTKLESLLIVEILKEKLGE